MANRLNRDQLLIRALDLIDSPRLDEKDRPSATIVSGAYTIGWLQEGLDLAHHLFPQSALLKTATFDITAGTATYTLTTIASDYLLDFKDGVLLPNDEGRLRRIALNAALDVMTGTSARSKPTRYAIHNGLLVLRPVPKDAYTSATLYYYSLPAALGATTTPSFPTDIILVEYLRLKGLEWLREVPVGTAESYLIAGVARLQKAGLGSEAEMDDTIGLDRGVFPGGGTPYQDPNNDWFTRVVA